MVTGIRKLIDVSLIKSVINRPDINNAEKIKMIKRMSNQPPKRKPKAGPPPMGYISITEASRQYGMSATAICKWIKDEKLTDVVKTEFWTYVNEDSLRLVINSSKRVKHVA
jgi:hypothetical protein